MEKFRKKILVNFFFQMKRGPESRFKLFSLSFCTVTVPRFIIYSMHSFPQNSILKHISVNLQQNNYFTLL